MAKQIGIYRYLGKMGQSVGFSNANASKAGTKFVREKAASVSNPRTYAQARQRAKVRPAALFYNAFVEVLNHAFLPAGRESKNRLRFMQLAMKLGVPNVYKDENVLPFNLPYQVSEGTLGVSSLTKVSKVNSANESGKITFPNFVTPAEWDDAASVNEMTIADFSSALIAANPQLVAGEELTFLAILQSIYDPTEQIPAYFSIVLDTADTLTLVGDMVGNRLVIDGDGSTAEDTGVIGLSSSLGGYKIVAGALIISHKTASTWNYTNSFLGISAYGEQIGWDEADIIASYMDGARDFDSSKILQQANNGQQQGVVPVSGENVAYSVTDAPEGATYNYATAAVVTMSDGQRRVVVDASGNLVSYQNGEFVTILQTVDGTATPLPKSATSWAGVNALSVSEVAAVPFSSAEAGITLTTSFVQPTSMVALAQGDNFLNFSEPVTFDWILENLRVSIADVSNYGLRYDAGYLVLFVGEDSWRLIASPDEPTEKTSWRIYGSSSGGPAGITFYLA